MHYREATAADAPAMGRARSAGGWTGGADAATMERYLLGEHHPQKALAPRAAFIAELDDSVIGFIAGHLTQRFGCNGELQWIYIAPDYRGTHVAAELLHRLAKWFIAQQAPRVCVNVEPDNHAARAFYTRYGARELNEYWLIWQDIGTVIW